MSSSGSLDDIPAPTESQAQAVLLDVAQIVIAGTKLIQDCRAKNHHGQQAFHGKNYCKSCMISAVVSFESIKKKLENA